MPPIPERTIERLCAYRRIMFRWHQQGKKRFHSHELADEAGITSAQVRRDMMSLKTLGTPKNGYYTDNIIEELGLIIEGEGGQKAVLVGVGNLGRAIASYLDGMRPDLRVVAAFDVDPAKVGQNFNHIACLSVDDLSTVVRQEGALIAIVAVPSNVAQDMANQLMEAGVRAFVNFTSVRLKVPENVFVQDIDIAIALEKSAYFARILGTGGAPGGGESIAVSETISQRKRVLCIDDDRDIIDSYRSILGSSGYDVEFAYDGDRGLALAKTCNPDLIILDVMMRYAREGFDVAGKLRQDEQLRYVPILMLTSVASEVGSGFDRDRDGLSLPVDAFVDKPVAPFTLLSAIRRLLSLSREQINVAGGVTIPRLSLLHYSDEA